MIRQTTVRSGADLITKTGHHRGGMIVVKLFGNRLTGEIRDTRRFDGKRRDVHARVIQGGSRGWGVSFSTEMEFDFFPVATADAAFELAIIKYAK
jgi:hypothetical protein